MRKSILFGGAIVSSMALTGGAAFAATATPTPNYHEEETGTFQPGYVQDPVAGTEEIELDAVPAVVLHAASVAFGGAEVTGAALDRDAIVAVYELSVEVNGRAAEADVHADGTLDELELTIGDDEVPANVHDFLSEQLPDFTPTEVERSIRPAKNGLLEEWYEFGGEEFDVEVNSSATAYLVEPA